MIDTPSMPFIIQTDNTGTIFFKEKTMNKQRAQKILDQVRGGR